MIFGEEKKPLPIENNAEEEEAEDEDEEEDEHVDVADVAPHSTLKRRATIMANIAEDKAYHLTSGVDKVLDDIEAREEGTEKKMGVYRKVTLAALHRHATLRVQRRNSVVREFKT